MKLSKQGTFELRHRMVILLSPLIGFVMVWGIGYFVPTLQGIVLDGEALGGLEGESIYPTLMNLVIAIYTLAVTVFIFLATALMERRADYEQETIHQMLDNRTKMLSWLSIISSVCIIGCLWIDRLEYSAISFKEALCWMSIVDICLLLIYSVTIINYEKEIVNTARLCRLRLENEIVCRNQSCKDDDVTLQMIGNLAMVIDRLIDNHVKEYHYNDRKQVLRNVIGKGLEGDTLADEFMLLISYRDFLRVEYSDSEETAQCAPQFLGIINRLRGRLKTELMMGESLTDMSFLGEHFYEHECPFNLNGSILSGSLFSEINMNCANLSGSDMSRTRLIGVQLEDADCTEAVFTETIWKDVKISPWSTFDKAVFRDADFNGLDICGGKIYDEFSLLQMTNASFVHANMLHCGLHYVNLSSSSMRNALLSDACFNTAALSSADLSGAIMTNAVFKHDGVYPNAFPPEVFAKMHMVNGMVLPGFELYIDVEGERKQLCPAFHANLEKATLAQSQISRYNWNGSRIADCNFTFAEIKDCIFDSCFGKNVTFRDAVICNSKFTHAMLNSADLSYAEISSCDFSDANLQGCLFIHKTDIGNDGHINGCCFDRSNFSGSQFQGCVFVNCSFKNANFAETTLMNVEFKNCTFLKTANFGDSYQIDVRGLPTAQKQAGGKKTIAAIIERIKHVHTRFSKDDDARCDHEAQEHSSV